MSIHRRRCFMKKTAILIAMVLVGTGVAASALNLASLGWTLKELDESTFFISNEQQKGSSSLELSNMPLWINSDDAITNLEDISIELSRPITGDIRLYTDKGNYLPGEPVLITIENNGDKDAYYCGNCPTRNTCPTHNPGTWNEFTSCLLIVYQIRNNIVHLGKFDDNERNRNFINFAFHIFNLIK